MRLKTLGYISKSQYCHYCVIYYSIELEYTLCKCFYLTRKGNHELKSSFHKCPRLLQRCKMKGLCVCARRPEGNVILNKNNIMMTVKSRAGGSMSRTVSTLQHKRSDCSASLLSRSHNICTTGKLLTINFITLLMPKEANYPH